MVRPLRQGLALAGQAAGLTAQGEARLLVVDGDAEGARVRVSHEALLSHWERARAQIAADARDLELRGRLEHAAGCWRGAPGKDRDSFVLAAGLPLQEALALVRRWGGGDLSAEIADFVHASRRAARRRRVKLALAGLGAVLSLPLAAAVVWAVMVVQGVRAVEAELEFVPVPAGCYQMGSPATEPGRYHDEGPVHEVCLKSFELGKFEVTQSQWLKVMVHVGNPSAFDESNFGGGEHPVEMISWHEAKFFLRVMTLFGHHRYRLPSEAEWEYAARAGSGASRFWGDDIDKSCLYANVADLTLKEKSPDSVIAGCRDGYRYTAPVGSFKPNGLGLYDMLGNVAEWVEDCYRDSYQAAPADGSAVTGCNTRVVRGGSWFREPRDVCSASRYGASPETREDKVGFRIVMERAR